MCPVPTKHKCLWSELTKTVEQFNIIIVIPVVSCEKVEVFLILNDMNNDLGTQLCKTRICLNVVSNIHPLVRRDLCRVICPLANVLFCPFMLELENLLSFILILVIKDNTSTVYRLQVNDRLWAFIDFVNDRLQINPAIKCDVRMMSTSPKILLDKEEFFIETFL